MKTVYVLVNTDLLSDPGKIAAQAVHSAITLVSSTLDDETTPFEDWHITNPRAVIILDGRDEETLKRFNEYLDTTVHGIYKEVYVDEGTDFHITALAVGPVDKDNSEVQAIFKQFNLWTPLTPIRRKCGELASELRKTGWSSYLDYARAKNKSVAKVLKTLEKYE